MAKGAAATSTLTLVKGALKLMAWAKMKMALIVGGVLIGASIAVVAIDDSFFELNGDKLAKAPDNVVMIRPTHFNKTGGGGSGMVGADERFVGQNYTIESLIMVAYQFNQSRMMLPTNLPAGGFDYLITLRHNPKDSSQEKVRKILQDEIKKQFGLVVHKETFALNTLLLKLKTTNAPGLKLTAEESFNNSAATYSVEGFSSKNYPMYGLAQDIENRLGMPVLDQTGLTNRYAIDLRWNKQPMESTLDATKRDVLNQLGLELVPTNLPIEMLVVERVK